MMLLKDISNNTMNDSIRYHESNTPLRSEQTLLYLYIYFFFPNHQCEFTVFVSHIALE